MTVKSFKKDFPEFAHLEGDALWDRMTEMAPKVSIEEYNSSKPKSKPIESYRFVILDFNKNDNS